MKSYMRYILGGFLCALLAIRMFCFFVSPISYQLFALFLAYTACVYLGAALSDSRWRWISLEFLVSIFIFWIAFLGMLFSPVWIATGFFLHGVYDMLHHPRVIQTKVVRWFPPLCATFDFVVGIYILVFY
jgi:hypothetical protein